MTPHPRCPPCPNCRHAAGVRVTVQSDVGWYCLCDNCGHIWHDESMPRQSPSWLDAAVVRRNPDERS